MIVSWRLSWLMRAFYSMVFLTALAGAISAASPQSAGVRCLDRVAREVQSGDSVTVVLNDSRVVRGNDVIVDSASSILFVRPVVGSGAGGRMAISLDRIATITYTKPSPVRFGFVLLGLGVGAFAGAAAGTALAPGDEDFEPSAAITSGLAGAIIGGLIGTAGGWEVGKQFRVTVTLKCR